MRDRLEEEGAERGDEELFALVHSELHRRARRAMGRQGPHHTLQATALVNEVYLRVVRPPGKPWNGRQHFLAVAAKAMRQILIDHARRRSNAPQALGETVLLERAPDVPERPVDVVALEQSLARMAEFDPEMARAVEMRFYAGASRTEMAEALGLAPRTFDRRWQAARAWILAELA